MGKYLIVDSAVLPDYFEKVLEVRNKARVSPETSISSLCEEAGISRSTYYKYRDHIYDSTDETAGRKAEFQLVLNHKQGVLKEVMETISKHNGNVLTIHQSSPINNTATLTLQVDVSVLSIEIPELIRELSEIKNVRKARMVSVE